MPKYVIGFAPTGAETADVVLLADNVCTSQLLGADVLAVSNMLTLAGIDPRQVRDAFANFRPNMLSDGGVAFAVFEISKAAYNLLKGSR